MSLMRNTERGRVKVLKTSPGKNSGLNLAHDIVRGKKSIEQARQEYGQIIRDHVKGEKHPYTQKLQFRTPRPEVAGDADVSIIRKKG